MGDLGNPGDRERRRLQRQYGHAMDTPLDAASTSAGTLFSSSIFHVPQFQREYAWGTDEVEEFFGDLARSLGDESYFLGLIIVTGRGASKDVVDGQQRLLTLTLLATVVLQQARKYERHALADRIEATFLRSINFETDIEVPRITLSSDSDNETLKKIVAGEHPRAEGGEGSVSSLLVAAYQTLEKKLIEDLRDDPFKRLGSWADFLTNRLYFARFVHPDPGSAYRVFEVINTRGKELTTADLLKSYVLSQTRASERQQRFEEWQDISRSFGEDAATSLVQFIRHAVTTLRGHILPRDMYDVLTARAGSRTPPMAPNELIELLQSNLPIYRQMMDPTLDGPASEPELRVYAILNALNVVSVRPILLAMHLTPNAASGAEALLRLVVRRIVVGSLGTGNVERRFGQAALRVASDVAWEPALEGLADLNPGREEFRERVHHRSLNKGVLSVIRESVLQGTVTPLTRGYLYLIKPRNADWSSEDEDRVAYWVSTIGNTFLATEPRRPMASSTWQGFKSYLAPHGVPGEWVENITRYEEWDLDAIDEVGRKLARHAAEVWYD